MLKLHFETHSPRSDTHTHVHDLLSLSWNLSNCFNLKLKHCAFAVRIYIRASATRKVYQLQECTTELQRRATTNCIRRIINCCRNGLWQLRYSTYSSLFAINSWKFHFQNLREKWFPSFFLSGAFSPSRTIRCAVLWLQSFNQLVSPRRTTQRKKPLLFVYWNN